MQNLESGKVRPRRAIVVILQQLTRRSQRKLKRNFEMVVPREEFEAGMIDSVISAGLVRKLLRSQNACQSGWDCSESPSARNNSPPPYPAAGEVCRG